MPLLRTRSCTAAISPRSASCLACSDCDRAAGVGAGAAAFVAMRFARGLKRGLGFGRPVERRQGESSGAAAVRPEDLFGLEVAQVALVMQSAGDVDLAHLARRLERGIERDGAGEILPRKQREIDPRRSPPARAARDIPLPSARRPRLQPGRAQASSSRSSRGCRDRRPACAARAPRRPRCRPRPPGRGRAEETRRRRGCARRRCRRRRRPLRRDRDRPARPWRRRPGAGAWRGRAAGSPSSASAWRRDRPAPRRNRRCRSGRAMGQRGGFGQGRPAWSGCPIPSNAP